MGNEEDKVILQKSDLISIELDELNYYESQLLIGKIKLEPSSEIIINGINIQLKRIQSFYLSEKGTNNIEEVLLIKSLDIQKNFKSQNSKRIKVPRGIHRINLENIFLPKGIPPSFEYPRSPNKAFIRYILSAELLLENEKEKHLTEEYICIRQRPFNMPSKIKYSDKKTIKKKSESCLNLEIGTLDLIINNPIKFGLGIDNKKCECDSEKINIGIFRTITLKAIKNDIIYETKIIEKSYPFKCLKGIMKEEYEDILFRDGDLKGINFEDKNNPYLGNVSDVNLLMPSLESDIIKCEYRLEVSPSYDANISDKMRPSIIIPVYAVHQSLSDYQGNKLIIEQQEDNLKEGKLFQQNKDIYNNNEGLSKLNSYSYENNFGQKFNNNKYVSGKIQVDIGQANPYQSYIADFPTKQSIINNANAINNNNYNKGNGNKMNNVNKKNNSKNNLGKGERIFDEDGRKIGFIKYKNLFP